MPTMADVKRSDVKRSRAGPALMLLAALLPAAGSARAENIDPGHDGSKYAWSENLGWLNAQPSGPGGPGVEVADTQLTGWMWSESAGWISLSCANTSSCGTVSYGVTNNGCGTLAGMAWSENAGWINFAPTACAGDPTCGVAIDAATGVFGGRAWSENAGWITFSSTGTNPYQVATGWQRTSCDDGNFCTVGDSCGEGVCHPGTTINSPPETQGLAVSTDKITFTWSDAPTATMYDVASGGIAALPTGPSGDPDAICFDHLPTATLVDPYTPAPGTGWWYVVRGRNECGIGTFGTQSDGSPRQTSCPN